MVAQDIMDGFVESATVRGRAEVFCVWVLYSVVRQEQAPRLSCIVSSIIIHGFINDHAWFHQWSCMVSSIIMHGFINDHAWFHQWSCMVSSIIMHGFRHSTNCAWSGETSVYVCVRVCISAKVCLFPDVFWSSLLQGHAHVLTVDNMCLV